ncbi:homoserine O-acetyltransferase [Jannaschia sp. R86511]|uniref:homoserine O-acetyltransferase MetX n=1 Tax=Jannaschia sp. R86511 TaxID=3093853 RepID=UPI0036D34C05
MGGRRFVALGPLPTESGVVLPDVKVAYECWGTPRTGPDGSISNAVLVLHALTGDSHVVGPAGPAHPSPGWWGGVVGDGLALDTRRWFVVAPNVLGGCQGTTGPGSPAPDGRAWGSRFPHVTVRDQVAVEAALADRLGVRRWALVAGGSMGGMRALEWAVGRPDRVAALTVLASTAAATGDQIAWCAPQIAAVTADPAWQGGDYYDRPGPGPVDGLGVARRIAHVTYRSRWEMDTRFGRDPQPGEDPGTGGRYAVESYLEHQAGKLAGRFDAGSYVTLTRSMNSHDVGRGRGGTAAALATVTARTTVVAVDSDRLYPPEQQQHVVDHVPGARLVLVRSRYGHDGFLVETAAVSAALSQTLAEVAAPEDGARCGA